MQKGKFVERKYPYGSPEWTAKNMNRKRGDTTFKQCGWCEFATGGLGRYNCMISTSCNLLKSYGIGKDVYWDTPCIVRMLGKKDILSVIKSKTYDIKSYQISVDRTENEIAILNNGSYPDKPPLPCNRVDEYNYGEIIWVFYQDKCIWERGVVVPGYRSHDGCVSFVLDNHPESRGKEDGDGPWGCGESVPGILKDWEIKYFNANLIDFQNWLDLSDSEYNGERTPIEKMYAAMRDMKNFESLAQW